MSEATEHYETIEGCKTQYLRGGKGPTVLFLHGGGGAGIWFPFFNSLSEKYDVVMPEHPGFGRSDTPPWLDNVGDLSNFYFEFIKKLGLKDIHLVGNSLGGWIAADMVVRNSTPFRSLTLHHGGGHPRERRSEGRHLPVDAGTADAQPVPQSGDPRSACSRRR